MREEGCRNLEEEEEERQDISTHSVCLRELLQELQAAWPLAGDAQEGKEWCSEAGALAECWGEGSPAPGS